MVLSFVLLLALSASLGANIFLAVYILWKKVKSPAAFYYFWFMVAVVLHITGDLFFQLSTSYAQAVFWINFYWAGFILLATLFFLFATNFPKSKKVIFQNEKSKLIVLAVPLILIYLLFFSNDFVSKIFISDTGVNYVIYGSVYFLAVLHLIVFLAAAFISLLIEYFKSKIRSEKKNILLVFLGVFFATIIGLPSDVFVLRALGFGELKITSILIFFGCIIISYVVVQHKIFIIKPVSEESVETKPLFSAKLGKIYSFDERNLSRRRAFRLFADQVKHNRQGLLVSTLYPEQVRRTYNLPKTPVIWLTDSAEPGPEKIKPKEIDALDRSICLFLEKASNPVLLLEGLKLLVIENGSDKVVEFLNTISGKAIETHSIIFFSLKGKEVDFLNLFDEVDSIKSSVSDLNKKYYSHTINEGAYLELMEETEAELVEKEAGFKLTEDELLGKLLDLSDSERNKRLLEKCIQIINYKLGKRSLNEKVAISLLKNFQKKLVEAEQQLKKKSVLER